MVSFCLLVVTFSLFVDLSCPLVICPQWSYQLSQSIGPSIRATMPSSYWLFSPTNWPFLLPVFPSFVEKCPKPVQSKSPISTNEIFLKNFSKGPPPRKIESAFFSPFRILTYIIEPLLVPLLMFTSMKVTYLLFSML